MSLFVLPQNADISGLKSAGIYVDELKRVDREQLEEYVLGEGHPELNLPHTFTHSCLTTSKLLKWIANYGLELAESKRSSNVIDEIDRRLAVLKDAVSDKLFSTIDEWSALPHPQLTGESTIYVKFETKTVEGEPLTTITVRDTTTGNEHTVRVHEY